MSVKVINISPYGTPRILFKGHHVLPRRASWRALVRKVKLNRKGCDCHFYSKPKIELLREAGFSLQKLVKVGEL